MTIYEVPNLTSGIDEALVGTISAVPAFGVMILVFVFLTVMLGGMINQRRRTGSSDVPMWATLASVTTLMVSLIMTMTAGLIQMEVVSIVITITIFCGLWLFLDKNRNEI